MVRLLENQEKIKIRSLYEHCFKEDTKEYIDYYFDNRIRENEVVVNEQDGDIVSAMHLIPKIVIAGNVKTNVTYIYAVGTWEKYRNKGYVKEIFREIINSMHRNMDIFTYLIPSSEENAEIYRKFGFEYVMDKREMEDPKHRKKPSHSVIRRKAENSDLVKLSIFAQQAVNSKYSISLSKDLEYFRKLKEVVEIEGGSIDIFVKNKVIVGYRIIIDDEVFEEVLDSSVQNLSWLGNQRTPYAMARIINIRKTLRQLSFKDFKERYIKITDPVIEENNGYFRMKYHHGSVKLEKCNEREIDKVDFDVTIGELGAHIFGYKRIPGFPPVCRQDSFFINDYV